VFPEILPCFASKSSGALAPKIFGSAEAYRKCGRVHEVLPGIKPFPVLLNLHIDIDM